MRDQGCSFSMVRSHALLPRRLLALDAPLHLEGMTGDDVAHGVGGTPPPAPLKGAGTWRPCASRSDRPALASALSPSRAARQGPRLSRSRPARQSAASEAASASFRAERSTSLPGAAARAGKFPPPARGRCIRQAPPPAQASSSICVLPQRSARSGSPRGPTGRAGRSPRARCSRGCARCPCAAPPLNVLPRCASRVELGLSGAQALLGSMSFACAFSANCSRRRRTARPAHPAPLFVLLRESVVVRSFMRAGLERLQVLEPDGNLQHAQLVAEDQIFLRLLRLRRSGPTCSSSSAILCR